LLSCCDVQDEVIIPEPFYANYLGFARLANVNIRPISTKIDDGFSLPSVDDFERLITSRTKAIFLCNPSNPTGQLYSKEDLEALSALVKKNNLFLIVDEVYKEFCYDGKFTSVLSFDTIEENVIVIDSISKVFSSCGARVGFLISKNKRIKESVVKYAQLRLCPPYYGQKLAIACYQNGRSYIDNAIAEYKIRRDILFQELSHIEGVKFYKPPAAFYNMVELPIPDAHVFCKWLLTDFSLSNKTVMLAPGNGFYFTPALGKSQVRIAYMLEAEELKEAMLCIKTGLQEFIARKHHEVSK